jgi:hypothetical protein
MWAGERAAYRVAATARLVCCRFGAWACNGYDEVLAPVAACQSRRSGPSRCPTALAHDENHHVPTTLEYPAVKSAVETLTPTRV